MVALNKATTITAAENKLLTLCDTIFAARNLSNVEEEIWQACMINIGLRALNQSSTETTVVDQQKIVVTLNKLSSAYNQQVTPILTL